MCGARALDVCMVCGITQQAVVNVPSKTLWDNTGPFAAALLDIFPCLAAAATNATAKATTTSIAAVIMFLFLFIVCF